MFLPNKRAILEMSNMFLKRVAKLLDGIPSYSYSEACKPIRARRGDPRKDVPSEFDIHNQVMHNTWGRIEFEIEPLEPMEKANRLPKAELDYRVRVKTQYRLALQAERARITQAMSLEALGLRDKTSPVQERPVQVVPADEQKTPVLQLPNPTLDTVQIQASQALALAKPPGQREFLVRESQRMLTLIGERKAHAEILKEKSVFVNFSLPVLGTLAKSPQTPKSALKWLAFHENPSIRKLVAKNRNTDLDILGILARDEDEGIRLAVAENPAVNKEFLLKLLNDDMSTVADKAKSILLEMTRSEANQNNQAALSALRDYVDHDAIAEQSDGSTNETDFQP